MISAVRVALLSAVCLFASACNFHSGTDAPEPEQIEMAVYDAPAGTAQQIKNVLQQAFYRNEQTPPVARATVTPDGKIIVTGPKSVQDGVANLMKNVGKLEAQPIPTIELKYWLVLAKRGANGVPPELAELTSTLNAVSGASGGLDFELLEELTIRSQADDDGEVEGKNAKLWQVASVTGGTLTARIDIDPVGPSRLKTRVQLEKGQTLVLGESGFELHPMMLKAGTTGSIESRKLFYVVRPTVIEAKKTP